MVEAPVIITFYIALGLMGIFLLKWLPKKVPIKPNPPKGIRFTVLFKD